MLQDEKRIFDGEKTVRIINQKLDEILIDLLATDDSEIEERQKIAESLKNKLDSGREWDEANSEWWYGFGKKIGQIKGMAIGSGLTLVGLVIGAIINQKH